MKVFYDAISLQNGRHTNMDSLLVKERDIAGHSVRMAVVCDGVGSLTHGAYAAAAAVQKLGVWFSELDNLERIGLRLRDAVLALNRQITQEAHWQKIQTAATLSALLLTGTHYYLTHVGDSRIYRWDGTHLYPLTVDDHTADGRLAAYVGHGQELAPQYDEGAAQGQWFLLCTDGLYKRMDEPYFVESMRRLREKNIGYTLQELAQHVIERGEKDNISAVLLRGCGGRRI